MSSIHLPVLVDPILQQWLEPLILAPGNRPPLVIVDGTFGGGGHSLLIAERLRPGDLLIGINRDPFAISRFHESHPELFADRNPASVTLDDRSSADLKPTWRMEDLQAPAWGSKLGRTPSGCVLLLACGSYCNLPNLLADLNIPAVHGILLDLGLSSDQLADSQRGFSFRTDAPLDLRFDPTVGISAADWLQKHTEKEIADAIYQFGEERFSRRIARAIIERNRRAPISTSLELADLIHRVVPGRVHGRVDSATRTFQALRIVVNRELEHVQAAMERLPEVLSAPTPPAEPNGDASPQVDPDRWSDPAGRMGVISFHSLEDRIIKTAMREDMRLKVLTKKPIVAEPSEIDENPRSRSAKLRIAERVCP